jgi:hypothetical protein
MKTSRPYPRSLLVCLAIAALAAGAPRANAQTCFPPEVAESSQPDRERIRQCVEANKDGLAGDADQIRRSRRALSAPFENPARTSVMFRVEVSRHLTPVLRPLISDSRDLVAANALQLAGEVATVDSISLIPPALEDPRPPVRYAAAYAYKRFFDQVRLSTPAVQAADAVQVIRQRIAPAIEKEKDPHVLDGLARVLESAAMVPAAGGAGGTGGGAPGVRAAAVEAAATRFGARIRAADADPGIIPSAIRAGQVLRDAVTKTGVPVDEPDLPDPVRIQVGGYGGDLLVYVRRRLAAAGTGGLPPADRQALAGLTTVGYSDYFFAASVMNAPVERIDGIETLVRDGRDQEFGAAVDRVLAALTRAPFSLPADRFRR